MEATGLSQCFVLFLQNLENSDRNNSAGSILAAWFLGLPISTSTKMLVEGLPGHWRLGCLFTRVNRI